MLSGYLIATAASGLSYTIVYKICKKKNHHPHYCHHCFYHVSSHYQRKQMSHSHSTIIYDAKNLAPESW